MLSNRLAATSATDKIEALSSHSDPQPQKVQQTKVDGSTEQDQVFEQNRFSPAISNSDTSTVVDTTTIVQSEPPSAKTPRLEDKFDLNIGDNIHRYLLLSQLGKGAMGVVYLAYDPDLDRKVAIKFIRTNNEDGETDVSMTRRAESWLLHEAQSMARISHPNVVTVFDVGVHSSHVFLAMELIEGSTLKAWLLEKNRHLSQIIRVFIEAGKGLACAHDSGLTHRDFKPDNVLIGNDGHVCVADFGLVFRSDHNSPDILSPSSDNSHLNTVNARQIGAGVLGTPGYMPPEQHRGNVATAASDQFSFCVGLYEAVYGVRPFLGRDLSEVYAAIEAENLTPPPRSNRAPRWLRHIILRGLSFDPKDRYPSMHALLAELGQNRKKNFRQSLTIGCATIGLGLSITFQEAARSSERQSCRQASQQIAGLWTKERQSSIQAIFDHSELSRANAIWEQIKLKMDQKIDRWSENMQEICYQSHADEPKQIALLDRQRECMHTQQEELQTFVSMLEIADESTIKKSIQTLANLAEPEECDGTTPLRAKKRILLPSDPVLRRTVQDINNDLAKFSVLDSLGQIESSTRLLKSIEKRAQATNYYPLLAKVYMMYSMGMHTHQNHHQIVHWNNEAMKYAESSNDDFLAAQIAIEKVFLLTFIQHDPQQFESVVKHAKSHLLRAGNPPTLRATMLLRLGQVYFNSGQDRLEQPATMLEEAAELIERIHGPKHWQTAIAWNSWGIALARLADYQDAIPKYRRSLEIFEELKDYLSVSYLHYCISIALFHLGDYQKSIAEVEQSIKIGESFIGNEFPKWDPAYLWRAAIMLRTGQHRRALQEWQSLSPESASTEPGSWSHFSYAAGLAETLLRLGQKKQAWTLIQQIEVQRLVNSRVWSWDDLIARTIHVMLQVERFTEATEIYQALVETGFDLREDKQDPSGLLALTAGDLELYQDNHQQAYQYHLMALDRAKERFKGNSNPSLAYYEQALARSSAAQHNWSQAINWQRQAINKLQMGLADSPQMLASAYLQLGIIYQNSGQWTKAHESLILAQRLQKVEEMDPKELAEIENRKMQVQRQCGPRCVDSNIDTTPPT